MSDSVDGVQLIFEAVWLTSLVLGLEIGWDVDASKTAWLAWRWEGGEPVGTRRDVARHPAAGR